MTKTWCFGDRHNSKTNIIIAHEKLNTKTKKLVKINKGTCSICGRNKSQIFYQVNDKRRRFYEKGKT